MKAAFLTLALAAVLVSGAAAASHSAAVGTEHRPVVFYGHVKSIARAHGRFEMRFDPALWLSGVAPSRPAAASRSRTTTSSSTRVTAC